MPRALKHFRGIEGTLSFFSRCKVSEKSNASGIWLKGLCKKKYKVSQGIEEPVGTDGEEDEKLTYGETQVNLIRANIFKKRTVNTPFKKRVKCSHCLTMFANADSLKRHLKRVEMKKGQSPEPRALGHLSLKEIKEAIYGSKLKKKVDEASQNEEDSSTSKASYLSLREIKEAFYGQRFKRTATELNEVYESVKADNVKTAIESNAVRVIQDNTPLKATSTFVVQEVEGSKTKLSELQSESEALQCENCEKTFPSKRFLRIHILCSHKKEESHLCQICGKQFNYRSSFIQHQATHQNLPRSHLCQECGASFTNARSLTRHYLTHYDYLEKQFVCELCGKRFASAALLKHHSSTHSDQRPFACRVCLSTFKRQSHLHSHEQGVHDIHESSKPKKFVCPLCFKGMARQESYDNHMKEHSGDLNFKCKDCHKSFASNTGLNIHISMGRCELYLKQCNVCHKEFKADDEVCEHLKAGKSEAGRRTKNRISKNELENPNVKSHLKRTFKPRHLKEKNFSCNVCGKNFVYGCELKTHFRLSHTDEKPYVCGLCGKCFKVKASLQMHEDVHADLRPYPCSMCEKRFRKTDHLKLHIRTHTGEKPHVCEICGRGFTQKGDMKKHVLKTHSQPSTAF